jgi:hypothetical protein
VHCHLAGGVTAPPRTRFETLAQLAGHKLRSHPLALDHANIVGAANDFHAWAMGLKELTGHFVFNLTGQQLTETGEPSGFIYGGTLHSAADVSANLCLALDAAGAKTGGADSRLRAIPGACDHLRKAQTFLDDDPPDLPNAAKEAISALEAVARHQCGDQTATLGGCLKRLREDQRLGVGLAQSLEKVWGFVNQSPGVRHGSASSATLTDAEARFIVAICEAGIPLLLAAT